MQAGVRKIEQAEIVMRTLEAIRYDIYFKPVWFIETDQTGLLPLRHTLWIIASMDFLTGEGQDFGQTWTLRHLDHCVKSTYRMMDGNRYKEIGIYLKKNAQRAPSNSKYTWLENDTLFKQKDFYRIPQPSVQEFINPMHAVSFS